MAPGSRANRMSARRPLAFSRADRSVRARQNGMRGAPDDVVVTRADRQPDAAGGSGARRREARRIEPRRGEGVAVRPRPHSDGGVNLPRAALPSPRTLEFDVPSLQEVPTRWQKLASSLFTHIDLTESGDNTSKNQSHRSSALPISSCHCCAPRRFLRLYQTATR